MYQHTLRILGKNPESTTPIKKLLISFRSFELASDNDVPRVGIFGTSKNLNESSVKFTILKIINNLVKKDLIHVPMVPEKMITLLR